MQQTITIFVACGREGEALFDEADSRLTKHGFEWDRDYLIKDGQIAFWSVHLDLWSMGDTFDRFLSSQFGLVRSAVGSHQLYAIRRDGLTISETARNEEEGRLLSVLQHAKNAYIEATAESYLFLIRTVFDASDGFNPEAQQVVTHQPV